MAWWAWMTAAAVLVVVVLTRRWNPISRASAASELGRRYPVLIHFWRVWTVLAAAGIAGVAILLAVHPGTHVATAPPPVAKPSPLPSLARSLAPSPTPSPVRSPVASASPTPVAVSPSQGHIPGPVFIAVLIGLGMAAALTVWLARRRREDPDYWLDPTDDDPTDPGGSPTGSGPAPTDPDNRHDSAEEISDDDTGAGGYEVGARGVVGAGPVRGVPGRGRRLPRRR